MKRIIKTPLQLGPILKDLRKENNLTQTQLSMESGLLQKTISALENGNVRTSIDSLINYINSCGYHLEFVKNENLNDSGAEW
jgi:transcriptional regulator with XRE-family HTH domain